MAILGLGTLLIFLLIGVVWAGSSAHYAIDWQLLSGGGAPAASGSGDVALNGSLGQTAIGTSGSEHYSLGAGYGYGTAPGEQRIYLPIVLRGS